MRKLLTDHVDAHETSASLRVIAAFDACTSDEGDLEDLINLAASLMDATVSLRDDLNRRSLTCDAGNVAAEQDYATATGPLLKVLMDRVQRGRHVAQVEFDDRLYLVVSLEHAAGRLGVAWSEVDGRPFSVVDEIIMERLGQTAAAVAFRDQASHRPIDTGRTDALEQLLSGLVTDQALLALARRALLHPDRPYRVVVVLGRPVAISPDVVMSSAVHHLCVSRHLSHTSIGAVVLGRGAVLVVPDTPEFLTHLDSMATPGTSPSVAVGVSAGHSVATLPQALIQARRVLALAAHNTSGVFYADDLGSLLLLAEIPATAVEADTDVRRLRALSTRSDDLAVLETYCLSGSLRKSADQLFMHHSSVDYRLKRLEQTLGFALTTRTGRLRALTAIRLVHLSSSGLSTAP